jgi:hypothetical protein
MHPRHLIDVLRSSSVFSVKYRFILRTVKSQPFPPAQLTVRGFRAQPLKAADIFCMIRNVVDGSSGFAGLGLFPSGSETGPGE